MLTFKLKQVLQNAWEMQMRLLSATQENSCDFFLGLCNNNLDFFFKKKMRFTEKCCFCTTSTAQSEASLSNGIQCIAYIKDQGASSRFTGVFFSGGMTCWNLLLSQPIWESWQAYDCMWVFICSFRSNCCLIDNSQNKKSIGLFLKYRWRRCLSSFQCH